MPFLVQVNTLASIQFTCVYLATKVVDRMPMQEMLCYILVRGLTVYRLCCAAVMMCMAALLPLWCRCSPAESLHHAVPPGSRLCMFIDLLASSWRVEWPVFLHLQTKLFGSVVTRAQAYDIESRCLDVSACIQWA
jgi:hypothetical protein